MDAEVVSNLSYAVWAGTAPNPSASLPFTGRTMAVAGASVCTDGSVTGEKCQGVVTFVDGCQRVSGFNVCGVDAATAAVRSSGATTAVARCSPASSARATSATHPVRDPVTT